ncbi:cytoskeletal protein RodZ [Sphingomonas jinjuensis]|uniref:Cytoskeletal protein RodZ n=1 Tax=Sphingomonas jinjuensis TaxID=535907 RepID=A0A840FF07_9SPHN|nr:helix-turn-helix domain-containing protein [Sphingomonas jinjuensis]MBB4154796.1 cytoskeletal protein RodZ [Sphingomonas jinjuensis]
MTEHDPGPAIAEPKRVGERLRVAREAQGLTTAEVGARTRIPLRHLEAIEAGDYTSLPSPTYAVGFARAYARLVGLDEVAVARDIRGDLDRLGPRTPEYVPYETADPARVPSRGVAIAAAGIALALLILVALWYGTDLMRGGVASDRAAAAQTAAVAGTPAVRPAPAPSPTPTGPGQVTLTANDEVWLRVYDAANKTLFIGTMKAGDRFDVPQGAADPKINVGRPDKLSVTLNGAAIPPLGDGSRPIKDVRVSAEAVQARLSGQPGGAPAAATPATTAVAPRSRPTAAAPSAIEPLPAPTFAPPSPAPSSTPTP